MSAVITLGVTHGMRMSERAIPLQKKARFSRRAAVKPSSSCREMTPAIQIRVFRKEIQKISSASCLQIIPEENETDVPRFPDDVVHEAQEIV